MTNDYQCATRHRIKTQIDAALREQYIRSASHIIEIINRARDLIDEQPAPVLESLIDYSSDLQRTDKFPKERVPQRGALREIIRSQGSKPRLGRIDVLHGYGGLVDCGGRFAGLLPGRATH